MADGNSYSFDIERTCGVISERSGGWKKELNLVSWSGRPARYDIRDWSPDHEKMGKGITLSADDLRQLAKLINDEIARLDEDAANPPTTIKEELKTEKTGQQAFEFTREKQKTDSISNAIEYDDL